MFDKIQKQASSSHVDGIEDTKCTSGCGLGLFLSFQLTTFLNGDIKISSKPGLGTEVRILIPIELNV